jgi:hypothetical protein
LRIRTATYAAANVGVQLLASPKFVVKLDHFAVDYGYVLIPLAWVAAFVVVSIGLALGDLFGGQKSAGIAEDRPSET